MQKKNEKKVSAATLKRRAALSPMGGEKRGGQDSGEGGVINSDKSPTP